MFSLSFFLHLLIEIENGSVLVFSKKSENAIASIFLLLVILIANGTLNESSNETWNETLEVRIFFLIDVLKNVNLRLFMKNKPRDLDRDRLLSLDFSRLREFERERLRVSLRDFERERVRLLRRRLSRESDLLRRRRRRSRLLDLLLRLSLLDPLRGSLILIDPGAR